MSAAGTTLGLTQNDLSLTPLCSDGVRTPHCAQEIIMIYLAVPGASMIPMRVLESDSIASVKLRIQSSKGFVVKKQKLVFDGRELARNDGLIRDYGVSDGNVLRLIIRFSDLRVVTVNTACGKKFKFHVQQGRTVQHVKQQIAKKGSGFTDLENQKLVFEGEELDDQRMIHDIFTNDDAVIHLLVRRSAKVRTKPVDKDFELSIVAPEIQERPAADDLEVITWQPKYQEQLVEPVIISPKVKLPQVVMDMIFATSAGLERGNLPIMSSEGTGGAYFMQDVTGNEYLAVFKPIDEEPMAVNNPRGLPLSITGEGLKRGTRVGEGALREVAAYVLDHPMGRYHSSSKIGIGFSGVPPTTMVKCVLGVSEGQHDEKKQLKIGSLQKFVKNYGSCEDMGPGAFPVQEVHKICVLDIRLANADRHGGNILITKEEENGPMVLIPIDHGYCLPENFEDCTFEWLYWPQSRQPFNAETIEYIRSLDAEEDIALLQFYGWEPSLECCRTLRVSTMLLKKGVEKGLTAYDIGSIMCRETVKKESKIEEIIHQAIEMVPPGSNEAALLESVSVIMDGYLDELTL